MFKFNKYLWDIGQKIEDETLPILNKYFNADFKRSNDIFDVLDFHDDTKKIICEIKGRRINHNQYKDTIITCKKITEGLMKIDQGYKVFFIFAFKDKTMGIELTENFSYPVKITGTNSIEHYLIPVKDLKEIDDDFLN